MAWDEENDITIYKVVVNHEEHIRYGLPTGRTHWVGGTSGRADPRQSVWPISGRCGPTCGRSACGSTWRRSHVNPLLRSRLLRLRTIQRRHPLSNAWLRGIIPLSLGYARTRMSNAQEKHR